MRTYLACTLVLCLVAAPAWAQTTGVPGTNDLTLNGMGSGGTSCVALSENGDNPLNVALSTLAGSPLVIATANMCVPGAIAIDATYSIDLDPGTFTIVAEGFSGGPFAAFFNSGPTGNWQAATAPAGPTNLRIQFGMINAGFPSGVGTTQAFDACLSGTTVIDHSQTLGDDTFDTVPLPANGFDFYGVNYTELFVGSNGFITFSAGDGDFSPSESEFNGQEPRIAGMWSDLSPNVSGQTTSTLVSDGCGNLVSYALDFVGVQAFAAPTSLNTFSMTLFGNGDIDMSWGDLDPSSQADLVGIGPGSGLSTASERDLSTVGVVVGGSNEAIYEFAGETACDDNVRDLAGGNASFTYDGVDAYTYTPGSFPLQVSSVNPAVLSPLCLGTVTINGLNIDTAGTYTVEFGSGNFATSVTVVDACTITCTPPAGAGTVDVIVTETTSSESDTLAGGFAYITGQVLFEAVGSNSFNSNTTSGYWRVQNLGTSADIAMVNIDLSGVGAGVRFDTNQTGMADRFDGGNSTVAGCLGTYRNGSDAATGLVYAAGQVVPSCDATALSGWVGGAPGTFGGDFVDVTFSYTSFGVCDLFEFDSDTDGAGTNGSAHAGATITVTLTDSTVLMGTLAADPNDPNRAFVLIP